MLNTSYEKLFTYLTYKLILLLSNEIWWQLSEKSAVYVVLVLAGSVETVGGEVVHFVRPL